MVFACERWLIFVFHTASTEKFPADSSFLRFVLAFQTKSLFVSLMQLSVVMPWKF